jgi:hypothetical protein
MMHITCSYNHDKSHKSQISSDHNKTHMKHVYYILKSDMPIGWHSKHTPFRIEKGGHSGRAASSTKQVIFGVISKRWTHFQLHYGSSGKMSHLRGVRAQIRIELTTSPSELQKVNRQDNEVYWCFFTRYAIS